MFCAGRRRTHARITRSLWGILNVTSTHIKQSFISQSLKGYVLHIVSTMSSSVQRCRVLLNNNFRKNLQHSIGSKSTSTSEPVTYQTEGSKRLIQQSRAASSRSVHNVVQARSRTVTSRDESREMMAVWPDVVRDLTDAGRHLDVPHSTKWMAKVLQYNVPSGKKNRGLAVVYAYSKLAPQDQLTEDNIRLARILGWCVELYQAFFLVEDDIMDGATTRRGQPCWYRQNNIGLSAINDGILLEQSIFQLLRTHFKDKECYLNLIETFHENILKTTMGQTLDLLSTQFGQKPKLELFTMDQYNAIVKYKTAYYSFVMPVSLAMYFAGITDPEMHRQAKTILLEMGHFFQVQDDFLDCYGDPEVTGKVGTDIQDGKCSWLAVVALQRATPAQKKILEECYGSSDEANVARVKQLYNTLGLATTYSVYEEESYNLMNTHIQQISRGLPHDLFFKFLEKIYRRDS